MATVKKNALKELSEIELFIERTDEKIKSAIFGIAKGVKRESLPMRIRNLKVAQIVILIQAYGSRIGESVSAEKSDLIDIVDNGKFEYILLKKKQENKLRTIEFENYSNSNEYDKIYLLLKKKVREFLNEYNSGLYKVIDKKAVYTEKLTANGLAKRVKNLRGKLVRDGYWTESEMDNKVAMFKALDKNQVGSVLGTAFKYIKDFTGLYNNLFKEIFGTKADSTKLVKVTKSGKKVKRTDKELEKFQKSVYSSHSVRAGFITRQFDKGISVEKIRIDIDHSSVNQTSDYVKIDKKDISVYRIENKPNKHIDDEPHRQEKQIVSFPISMTLKKYVSRDGSTYEYSNLKELRELKDIGL